MEIKKNLWIMNEMINNLVDGKKVYNFLKDKFGITDILGKGTNGYAYDTLNQNVVVKLTSDLKEATNANDLIGKNLKHYVKIYAAYKVKSTKQPGKWFYIITMEKVKTLNDLETNYFFIVEKIYSYLSDIELDLGIDRFKGLSPAELLKKIIYEKYDQTVNTEVKEIGNIDYDYFLNFYNQYSEMKKELKKYHLFDEHFKNVGYNKEGNLVAFDLQTDKKSSNITTLKMESLVLKILKESKQVGNLYHFTSINNLDRILSDDKLFFNTDRDINGKIVRGVSTTRDKNFWNINRSLSNSILNVRITLDGNKLSTKYKIRPFNFSTIKTRNQDPSDVESEERIITDMKGLTNLANYIIGIELKLKQGQDFLLKYELNKIKEICFNKDINLIINGQ